MSTGASAKSVGPLPRFGGPASKSYYTCQICFKDIRRDKIKDHLNSNVDCSILKAQSNERSIHIARLPSDKRLHTEKVLSFFDQNGQLPYDFNNSSFWIQVNRCAEASTPNSIMSNFLLSSKRGSSDGDDVPSKKQATEIDVEIDIAEELNNNCDLNDEDCTRTSDSATLEEIVEESAEILKASDTVTYQSSENDIKEVVMSAVLKAFKDQEASMALAELIALNIKKLEEKKSEEHQIDESIWMTGEDFISCIPCLNHSDDERVPSTLRRYRKGNFGRIKANSEKFHIRHSQKEHESNELHIWCIRKCEQLEADKLKKKC